MDFLHSAYPSERRGFLLFSRSLSEEIGRGGFFDLSLSDTEDYLDQVGSRDVNGDAVELQKYQCCSGANALIAIHEGVVLDDVKEIGRGHFKKIRMQVTASETGLRHGNRRFQKGQVTDARTSAVSFDLISVDLKNFLQAQKDRFHRLVGQPPESPAIAFVHPRQGGAKRFYAFGITDGRDNQAFAIGGHSEWSVGINFQEIQYTPINDEGQAVPVLG